MDAFVEVDGRKVALRRDGDGGPAVVFLPGAGAVGLDYRNVQRRVAEFTTAVVYDRGGTGYSDAVPLPRTAEAVAAELKEALRDVPGPYVFVAHSLGGAYARRFLQLYPSLVAGVVYLESFYEEWDAYLPAKFHLRDTKVPGNFALRLVGAGARGLYRKMLAGWPDGMRERLIRDHLSVAWQRSGALERSNLPAVRDELEAAGAVPDVPSVTIVALGIDPGMRLFLSPKSLRELSAAKRGLYRALAGDDNVIELANARHSTLSVDCADEVVAAIHGLWERVR